MAPVRSTLITLFLCVATALPCPALAETTEDAKPSGGIPFKQEKQSTETLAYQSFVGLLLAGLAAYGIVLGLKRFSGRTDGVLRKARRIHALEAYRLSRRNMLYVVEFRGQELLLAENEQGVQLLSSHPLQAKTGEQGVGDA